MGWRIVHVKESESMQLRLDNLQISKQGFKYFIPLADINMIVIEGRTTLTTSLMAAFTKYNIVTIICDKQYLPTGILLSYGNYHHMAKRTLQQIKWTQEIKKEIWKNVIGQKIANQIRVTELLKVEPERIELMKKNYQDLTPGDQTNREGHTAKVYFNSLYGLNFTRDKDCLENSGMNYGYTIIRAAVARLVVGQGLIPVLGIFHHNEFNSFNLVDDLMEPFRPLMDYWLIKNIFHKYKYLSYEARLIIINFLNQEMIFKGTHSSIDQIMDKYITSFVEAMSEENTLLLERIKLDDFLEAMK